MDLFDTVYNGKPVSFDFTKDRNVMVNATEMAKIFGKKINHFMENETTKSFISECLKSRNSGFLNVESEADLYISKQKSGTWMHRILAIKFAAWLDPAFELWVYTTIDKILFEHYRNMEKGIRESARRRVRMDRIRNVLATNDLYLELQKLELEERQATYRRGKGNQKELNKYKMAFAGEEEE